MQPLNYCRQMVKQFQEMHEAWSRLDDKAMQARDHCADLAAVAKKFILPPGGKILDDPELRALDDSIPLALPFDVVALEFEGSAGHGDPCSKHIVLAVDHEDEVAVYECSFYKEQALWMPSFGRESVPKSGYLTPVEDIAKFLDRDKDRLRALKEKYHGEPKVWASTERAIQRKERALATGDGIRELLAMDSLHGPTGVLLGFLNALQCSNVRVEERHPKKSRVKSALPFDTYHVLTIDVAEGSEEKQGLGGSHRSPREHLRRGHIRRLSDGRRLWINATVVAAGRGAGKVMKDYSVRSKP